MEGIRKLACLSAGFSLAVFAAHYILPIEYLYIAAALIAALSSLALVFRGKRRGVALLLIISAAVGLAAYRLHFDNTVALCESYDGRVLSAELEQLKFAEERDGYYAVELRLCGEDVPRLRTLIYTDKISFAETKPGDRFYAELKLKNAAVKSGERYDGDISDGVYLIAELEGSPRRLQSGGFELKYLPQFIGKAVRECIRDCFSGRAESFMLALLSGDKTEYYSDEALSSAMSGSGLSHVVAVSGMHVSFLVAFFVSVLGNSRRVSLISLLAVWLFVIMSGSSPSALRAGIMISMSLAAPIFRRENDRITSLLFALALILLSNPFAIASVSLQLSFAAMAGIYSFTRPIYDYVDEHTPSLRRLLRLKVYINGAFSNSVAVTVFTMPIMALNFGSVPLLAPLANILCLWVVSLLFCGGFAVTVVALVLPAAARIFAGFLSLFVDYIYGVASLIKDIPFSNLYTDNRYAAAWVLFVYLIFAFAWLTRDKTKSFKPLLPTAVGLVTLASVFLWSGAALRADSGTAAILDVGNGQCTVLTQSESAVVIDCGGFKPGVNAGSEAANYLHSLGRTRLDCLMLTRLTAERAGGAVRLLNRLEVDCLVLPEESPEGERGELLDGILEAAEARGTRIIRLNGEQSLRFGSLELRVYEPQSQKAELCLTAQLGDKSILITSDYPKTAEHRLCESYELSDTDVLIVGQRGSSSAASEKLLLEASPELAVISVGNDKFGRPSPELIHRLGYYGIKLLRTDTDGRIIIRAGG